MGRPLSGKTAPQGRMSLIDRMSGGSYTPPAPQPMAMPRQLESVNAPEKNNNVKPAAETVATSKPVEKRTLVSEADEVADVSEADEDAEYKKKMEAARAEKDIKAYARKKAQKEAAAKLKKK